MLSYGNAGPRDAKLSGFLLLCVRLTKSCISLRMVISQFLNIRNEFNVKRVCVGTCLVDQKEWKKMG